MFKGPMSQAHKDSISNALKGRKLSEEHRRALSRSKIGDKNPRYGVHAWFGHNYNTDGPTEAEVHFAKLHPHLEKEVRFGTGKGGKAIWGTTWFLVDFLDRDKKIAYEIDGSWHLVPERQERDRRKKAFLATKGIKVIHYTNEEVLAM